MEFASSKNIVFFNYKIEENKVLGGYNLIVTGGEMEGAIFYKFELLEYHNPNGGGGSSSGGGGSSKNVDSNKFNNINLSGLQISTTVIVNLMHDGADARTAKLFYQIGSYDPLHSIDFNSQSKYNPVKINIYAKGY